MRLDASTVGVSNIVVALIVSVSPLYEDMAVGIAVGVLVGNTVGSTVSTVDPKWKNATRITSRNTATGRRIFLYVHLAEKIVCPVGWDVGCVG
jgi:hypothetical protein